MSSDRSRARRRTAPEAAPAAGRLALPDSVTIRTVDAVRAELLAMLQQHAALVVDCSALAEADLSLIQLLLAARKSARAAGTSVALARPAAGALRETLLRGGFLAASGGPPKEEDAFWLQGATAP